MKIHHAIARETLEIDGKEYKFDVLHEWTDSPAKWRGESFPVGFTHDVSAWSCVDIQDQYEWLIQQ